MPENPSADKFAPPPGQERFEAPTPRQSPVWAGLVLTLGLGFVRYQLEHVHFRGWTTMTAVGTLFGVAIAEYVLRRRFHARRSGTEPYTPPQNISR